MAKTGDFTMGFDAGEATREMLGIVDEEPELPFAHMVEKEEQTSAPGFLKYDGDKKEVKNKRAQFVFTKSVFDKLKKLQKAAGAPSMNAYIEMLINSQYELLEASKNK